MSTFGVDYSTGPPTIQELKNAKVTFVGRYVSTPGHPKNLKPAEAERLSEAGIDIVVFFQHGREFMVSDRHRGARDARSALAQARGCGMPGGRPIYFALDIDPRPLSARQWDAVLAYLDGAAAELGRDNVGIYGGRLAIDKALGAGKARWGWQTKSWSDGVWSDRAHVRQFEHDLPLGSGKVDNNRAMTDDFGQWKVGDDMPLNDDDKKWLKLEIRNAINNHADALTTDPPQQPQGDPGPARRAGEASTVVDPGTLPRQSGSQPRGRGMTNSGVNDTDPVRDDDFPRITAADPSLPTPPDQEGPPERGEQPEPEQMEMP